MRVEVNKQGQIDVFADTKDICYACKNNTDCPLIEALRAEIVFLHYEEIDVQTCGLFRKRLNNVKD